MRTDRRLTSAPMVAAAAAYSIASRPARRKLTSDRFQGADLNAAWICSGGHELACKCYLRVELNFVSRPNPLGPLRIELAAPLSLCDRFRVSRSNVVVVVVVDGRSQQLNCTWPKPWRIRATRSWNVSVLAMMLTRAAALVWRRTKLNSSNSRAQARASPRPRRTSS